MPLSLNPVDVTPTSITATPSPVAITSHSFPATIPKHVTAGTNNGSDSYISDGIMEIIEFMSPPSATVTLNFLCDIIQNALSQAQGYLQEEVAVAGIPTTVLSISEP